MMASCYNSTSTNLPQPVGLTAIVRSRTIVAGQAAGFLHPATMNTTILAKGSKIARWTVIEDSITVKGRSRTKCQCECGTIRFVMTKDLMNGKSKSCRCLTAETAKAKMLVHGHSTGYFRSPEYRVWCAMKNRCTNPNGRIYRLYGLRGIKVCDRWLKSFANFLADMGKRPEGTSLDRINNDGNYEPGNCRWATAKVQANNLRTNRVIEFSGERRTVSQWSDKTGIKRETITHRLKRGWSIGKALQK